MAVLARSRNLAANRRSLVLRLRAGSVPPKHKKKARHEIWTVQEKCRPLEVRPTFQMGQSSSYSQGEDNPTVTVKCTNSGCDYTDERPGGRHMVGKLYPHTQ